MTSDDEPGPLTGAGRQPRPASRASTVDQGPPPASAVLRHTLDALGISQVELAEYTGLSTKHVNQIISGKVKLSPACAVKIAAATGIPAHVWCALEAAREIWEIQRENPPSAVPIEPKLRRQRDAALAGEAKLQRRVDHLEAALESARQTIALLKI